MSLYSLAITYALHSGVSVGISYLILQFSSFLSIGLSIIFLSEKPSTQSIIGMIVGFMGVFYLAYNNCTINHYTGILALLVAAISFAIHCFLSRKMKQQSGTWLMPWIAVLAAPILLLASYYQGNNIHIEIYSANSKYIMAILFMSLLVTGLAHSIWAKVVHQYPLARVMPFYCLTPLFSCIFGKIFLQEIYDSSIFIGATLIISGLLLSPKG